MTVAQSAVISSKPKHPLPEDGFLRLGLEWNLKGSKIKLSNLRKLFKLRRFTSSLPKVIIAPEKRLQLVRQTHNLSSCLGVPQWIPAMQLLSQCPCWAWLFTKGSYLWLSHTPLSTPSLYSFKESQYIQGFTKFVWNCVFVLQLVSYLRWTDIVHIFLGKTI